MRETAAVLLIADISGYTRFVVNPTVARRHREEILSELIETLLDQAEVPLVVNKLEGDAVLAYAEYDPAAATTAAVAVLQQAVAMRPAFMAARDRLRHERRHCPCDACAQVQDLGLKAFLHAGDIAIKQIRQFNEIAGEAVILIHRLLKNKVPEREYLLLTEAFRALLPASGASDRAHCEAAEGIGEVACWVRPY